MGPWGSESAQATVFTERGRAAAKAIAIEDVQAVLHAVDAGHSGPLAITSTLPPPRLTE